MSYSLDDGMVLSCVLIHQTASPGYCETKTRDEILNSTIEKCISTVYARKTREALEDPATINDLAPEVLRKCFVYLVHPYCNSHLASAALTNRAFHPVALDVMRSRAQFCNNRDVEVIMISWFNF